MPTYEYECQQCGHRFEEFQNITAAPLQTCSAASCTGSVKRLIGTGGGLLFKGTGFYTTDYRSAGYQKAAKADKDSKDSKGSKDSSKSEAGGKKSEAKAAKAD